MRCQKIMTLAGGGPPPEAALNAVLGYEQILIGNDEDSGLHAIVAVHSTALGPALGGTRMRPYANVAEALHDVLDLAQAMTRKNALAGLPHGGGKAVIIGDPSRHKSPELLRAYGRLVASMQGRYVTAADVGTYVADMDLIAEVNPWTTGRSPQHGGAGDSGVLTALGVFEAMLACAEHTWGAASLAGRRVGVEGVGKVGARLVGHALAAGARVVAADVNHLAIERLLAQYPDVEVMDREALLIADLDVLSPCALAGTLTPETIAGLRSAVVCGGANNQLSADGLDQVLAERGVLLCPDFLANAGGVIAVADEYAGIANSTGYDRVRAESKTREIGATTARVLAKATASKITPLAAARAEADSIVAGGEPGRRTWPGMS